MRESAPRAVDLASGEALAGDASASASLSASTSTSLAAAELQVAVGDDEEDDEADGAHSNSGLHARSLSHSGGLPWAAGQLSRRQLPSWPVHGGSSSGRRSYREALSSLLWAPYECQQRAQADSSSSDEDEALQQRLQRTTEELSVAEAAHSQSESGLCPMIIDVTASQPGAVSVSVPCARLTVTATEESAPPETNATPVRTYTSTEAQTDPPPSREERRRARRQRRFERRLQQQQQQPQLPDLLTNTQSLLPPPYVPLQPQPLVAALHPHQHPGAVTALRFPLQFAPPSRRRSAPILGAPIDICPGATGLPGGPGGGMGLPPPTMVSGSPSRPKSCCGLANIMTQALSVRWFIVLIAFVGVCCAVVGTVLGAMKASGREHLTVSLLMIGVGVVLVTVSGLAWRLTARDAPTCASLLGLGSSDRGLSGAHGLSSASCGLGAGGLCGAGGLGSCAAGVDDPSNPTAVTAAAVVAAEANRRFVPRLPPNYGRPHHPYAAMMYPEFQYRPPPPSYQASMQEYRLRLLLLDRGSALAAGIPPGTGPPAIAAGLQPPTLLHHTALSPPPTYRSQAGSTLSRATRCDAPSSDYSRPPSYRSRASCGTRSALEAVLTPGTPPPSVPSDEPLVLTSPPSPTPPLTPLISSSTSLNNTINTIPATNSPMTASAISLKVAPPPSNHHHLHLNHHHHHHLHGSTNTMAQPGPSASQEIRLVHHDKVTIVQTSSESIVTVSGSAQMCTAGRPSDAEMEILAHL